MPATKERKRKTPSIFVIDDDAPAEPARVPVPMPTDEEFALVPLDRIRPSKTNPRRTFAGLEDLAASLTANGVIEPLIVRPLQWSLAENAAEREVVESHGLHPITQYELVCGERRLRAAKLAKLKAVPCIIRAYTDVQAVQVQLRENHDRDDVHPLEELSGFERLMAMGETVDSIEAATGYTRKYIAGRLQLTKLIKPARDLFAAGEIGMGHATQIARLPPAAQQRVVAYLHRGFNGTPTSEDLADWIRRDTFRELADATWKLDDGLLVPTAGPCSTCLKNSANQRELFEADELKQPQCMDVGCYTAKQTAFVQLQIKRHTTAGEAPLLLANSTYDTQKVYKGVRSKWDVNILEVKKGAEPPPKAKLAIVVDGDEAGQAVYVAPPGKLDKSVDRHAAAERKKVQAARERQAAYRRIVAAAAQAAVEQHTGPEGGSFTTDQLRLMAMEAFELLDHEGQKRLCAAAGLKPRGKDDWGSYRPEGRKHIQALPATQLAACLLQCLFSRSTYVPTHANSDKEKALKFKAIADAWGVDYDAAMNPPEPTEPHRGTTTNGKGGRK